MVFIGSLVSSLLLVATAVGTPLPPRGAVPSIKLPVIPRGLLCALPAIKSILCPRQGATSFTVITPIGLAKGVEDGNAFRYAVKYASAARWQTPSLVTSWSLPNGNTDPAGLPLSCPQSGASASTYSEDCLSMLIYVPKNVVVTSNVPVLVWIHGGSFITGSATGPGLDGSNLAASTNSIVVVIQYRLGGFGFLSASGGGNYGVQDAVAALKFINQYIPAFGGRASQVTVAGQSAGAGLIRALLATPSASSYFASAIMQSDPMDYGFYTNTIQQKLNADFLSGLGCSSSDSACLSALSTSKILSAADNTAYNNAVSIDPSTNGGEPLRPYKDGSLITSTMGSARAMSGTNKPVLVTTVKNEATYTIYGVAFPDAVPAEYWSNVVDGTYDSTRAGQITSSSFYRLSNSKSDDIRPEIQVLGTDSIWRCAAWSFARNWASAGGRAFVGNFVVGATYPGNGDVGACTFAGAVCHQDDIQIVFGTVDSPSPAQSALTREIQARYSAFMRTGNPNAPGFANWAQATTGAVHSLQLGGSGETPVGACDPGYWGVAPQFDYQYYGLA